MLRHPGGRADRITSHLAVHRPKFGGDGEAMVSAVVNLSLWNPSGRIKAFCL